VIKYIAVGFVLMKNSNKKDRDMKRIPLIIFVMIIILAATFYVQSFYFRGQTIQVNDVTQRQIITLLQKDKLHPVYGINILITGYVDGTATIQQAYENKKMYGPYTLRGKVKLPLRGDWYGDECLIIYEPFNVKSGKLQIKYAFRTIR
jgi:hypothetical protein